MTDMKFLKLPASEDAEQATLGAMLLDKETMINGLDTLSKSDFYFDSNGIIFDAMQEVNSKNKPVDIVTVTEVLQGRKAIDKVGGVSYLSRLAESVPTTANSGHYINIVKEKSQLRNLIDAGKKIQELGYNSEETTETLSTAEGLMFQVFHNNNLGQGMAKTKDFIYDYYNQLESRATTGKGLVGISTGYIDLDNITGGLQKSDLIIIGGRPSMGKTAIALNIGQNVCNQGGKTSIFSLEMSKEQLLERVLCAESQIPSEKMKLGNLNEDEWDRVRKTLAKIKDWDLEIDDNPSTTVGEIRSKLRRSHAEKPIDLVIIDYLGLINHSNSKANSKADAIGEMTKALKQLARELDVPIVLLSQLNRGVEQREDKRPMMSDIRDSGSVEQDADLIMFAYRDEYYDVDSPKKGIAELIIAKQRRGAVGTVELAFIKQMTKFVNLDKKRA